MKAMLIHQFGATDQFQQGHIDKPTIKPGHVLVKVMASSVNPLDCKIRQGLLPGFVSCFPAVLHGDVAGVVEEVGEGVTSFSRGDEIYGCAGGLLEMGGALADYMLVDVKLIAHKPKKISFAEAAALPLVAITAWEGLKTYANLQKGETVLIHGGTGGVGHIAIQLGKHWGAKIYSTSSSTEKMQLAKELGADVTLNYKDTTLDELNSLTHQAGFHLVFDTVGGENLALSIQQAGLYGKVISILAAGTFDLTPAFLKGLSLFTVLQPLPLITGINRERYGHILKEVADLVDAGVIRPLVDKKQFTFDEVGLAHAYLESGQAVGKVVLTAIK